MSTQEYWVEMKLVPPAVMPSPAEGIAFTERFVLPTLAALEKRVADGSIVAGGPTLGGTAFTFIARVGSPPELDDIVGSLPLWPRSQTTVVPLTSFAQRSRLARERLARLKSVVADAAATAAPTTRS